MLPIIDDAEIAEVTMGVAICLDNCLQLLPPWPINWYVALFTFLSITQCHNVSYLVRR